MQEVVDWEDDAALTLWIDKLHDMVERQQESLQHEETRRKAASLVLRALHTMVGGTHKRALDAEVTSKLLGTTKVMMRDRRGIDALLTIEALELFLFAAEGADVAAGEEALKCAINSVFSRPGFVRDHALPHGFKQRLLLITARAAPASFHWMAWKALLVACEADEMVHALTHDITTWKQLYATLHFCLHGGGSTLPFPSGIDRTNLFVELVKLIAVLVNGLKPSDREAMAALDSDEFMTTLQPLGRLLLETLRYSPPLMSPFSTDLIDLKNKVMEIFMFIPTELLAFFYQQQQEALSAILGHLHTMIVLIRIEKTRTAKDLQPTLVACYHLTSTGDRVVIDFFRMHVFPASEEDLAARKPSQQVAPPAFFHKHLTFFLTSLDTAIKRTMGEWLYLLCDQNGARKQTLVLYTN